MLIIVLNTYQLVTSGMWAGSGTINYIIMLYIYKRIFVLRKYICITKKDKRKEQIRFLN